MSYTNASKPSETAFSSDSKPTASVGSLVASGTLFFSFPLLTYSEDILTEGYINDSENSGSFTNDSKP